MKGIVLFLFLSSTLISGATGDSAGNGAISFSNRFNKTHIALEVSNPVAQGYSNGNNVFY